MVTWLGDAYQFPTACQLFSVQIEEQLACGHTFTRIAYWLPRATIPDNHRAGAILFGRDLSLKIGIVERVVLHMDRDTLFAGIVARALGHRPTEQHAIEFEPEIVVQPLRPMLLDHEA
ncbi:hypothetical protein D9M72_420720 [compost metagenome]